MGDRHVFKNYRLDAKRHPRKLKTMVPPIRIEEQYAKALVDVVMGHIKKAYAPLLKELPKLVKAQKERMDFDPEEARDPSGKWTGGSGLSTLADAGRQPLERSAPRGWTKSEPTASPEQLASKLQKLEEKRKNGEGYSGLGDEISEVEEHYKQAFARSLINPKGLTVNTYVRSPVTGDWIAPSDGISRPGHLYRGMSSEEYASTVGAGKGVQSNNSMSVAHVEGTSFGYDAATANSYVNNGSTDPRKTEKPTFIVEVKSNSGITYNPIANYPQSVRDKGVGHQHITRVFQFEKAGDELAFREIPIPQSRTDSPDSVRLAQLVAQAGANLQKVAAAQKASVAGLAQKFAQRTSTHQRIQLHSQVHEVLGVDVSKLQEPDLTHRTQAFVTANVNLIKTIPLALHDDVVNLVHESVTSGRPSVDLADDIRDRFGVAERHARMIAGDQTRKYYADVNHTRQRALGVRRFIWRTLQDERVRGDPDGKYPNALPSHFDLEGLMFSYDDPPVPIGGEGPMLPGQDYACRCYAEPVLDDVLGPDDEEGDEGSDDENPDDDSDLENDDFDDDDPDAEDDFE